MIFGVEFNTVIKTSELETLASRLTESAPLQDCIFSCEEEDPCCVDVIWRSITNWWHGLLSWLGMQAEENRTAEEVQIWEAVEEMGTYAFSLQTETDVCKEFLEEIFNRCGDPEGEQNVRRILEAIVFLLSADDPMDVRVEIGIDFVAGRRCNLNIAVPKNGSILATESEMYWASLRDQWNVEERVGSTSVLTLKKRFAAA